MGPTAKDMMAGRPPEAMRGAVPQAQAPQGQPAQSQGQKLPPEQMDALRKDPEVIEVFRQISGEKDVPMDQIPDDALIAIAGAVHKLGVQQVVSMITKKITPEQMSQFRNGRTK